MGWEQGKGLGAKEDGMTENIKVKYKSDTKGVGFNNNEYENVWLDHQDDFESLLSSLNKTTEKSVASLTTTNTSTNEQVQSLEEKSKQSRARLHYKKFTRSKDLSNASFHDLNCILGKEKRKQLSTAKKNDDVINSKSDTDSSDVEARVSFKINDNSSEVKNETKTLIENPLFSTNKTSLNDYFASKMANKFKKAETINNTENVVESKTEAVEVETNEPEVKKVKKSKKANENANENKEEKTITESDSKMISKKDIKSSFKGSNLHQVTGYSAYTITQTHQEIIGEKMKKVQKKKSIETKNLESNPDFYKSNKRKMC